ncbi:MAG: hypothetical protein ACYSWP_03205 [Planctomycetota bacterium]|jgi:hypothetical protein
MARNRRKKALYEVIKKDSPKDSMSGRSGPLRPDPVESTFEVPGELPKVPVVEQATDWPRKPLLVQLGTGRIDFSLPYPFAAAVVLALLLLLVLVYRAGQLSGTVGPVPVTTDPAVEVPSGWKAPVFDNSAGSGGEVSKSPVVSGSGGDNVIVLQEYPAYADLLPARKHFNDNGIEVEVRQVGNSYLLISKARYDTFSVGSAGYAALARIKEIGALYAGKAPDGYETFAPHYFSDAYGKKVK